ncbi:unnamed protein product, partial [Ectocarpus sp. 12 AP-2014]
MRGVRLGSIRGGATTRESALSSASKPSAEVSDRMRCADLDNVSTFSFDNDDSAMESLDIEDLLSSFSDTLGTLPGSSSDAGQVAALSHDPSSAAATSHGEQGIALAPGAPGTTPSAATAASGERLTAASSHSSVRGHGETDAGDASVTASEVDAG